MLKTLRLDKPTHLTYDGSHLGEFNFEDVMSYIAPCNNFDEGREFAKKSPVLFALFRYNGHDYPIVLKRNRMCRTDQAVIDQIKPLFGLRKMGCHRLRLNGVPVKKFPGNCWLTSNQLNLEITSTSSEFYIFQSSLDLLPNNSKADEIRAHRQLIPLGKYVFADPTYKFPNASQQKLIKNLREILVFRDLVGITKTNLNDILACTIPDQYLLSIDEMKANPCREDRSIASNKKKDFPEHLRKILFADDLAIPEICIQMINCTPDNYLERLSQLQESMYEIFAKLDDQKFWMVPIIIDNLKSYIELKYA